MHCWHTSLIGHWPSFGGRKRWHRLEAMSCAACLVWRIYIRAHKHKKARTHVRVHSYNKMLHAHIFLGAYITFVHAALICSEWAPFSFLRHASIIYLSDGDLIHLRHHAIAIRQVGGTRFPSGICGGSQQYTTVAEIIAWIGPKTIVSKAIYLKNLRAL